jgi:hypothetical protein
LEGDFDPAEHDRRMREMFDTEFYDTADADAHKPDFPDLDQELEIGETILNHSSFTFCLPQSCTP